MRGYKIERDDDGLTAREREVLDLYAEGGKTFVEIADTLGVSRKRVNNIVTSLVKKGRLIKQEGGRVYGVVPPNRKGSAR